MSRVFGAAPGDCQNPANSFMECRRGRAFATRWPAHYPQRAQTGRSIPQPKIGLLIRGGSQE